MSALLDSLLDAGRLADCILNDNSPEVIRAYAVQECSPKDGFPTGFYDVTEDFTVNGAPRTRRVAGTRARSAGKAMELYRKGMSHG